MHNYPPIPFQCIFQGNIAGPTIWVSVSVPLIEIMQGVGHVITFEAPLSRDKYILVVFTFVDNAGILEGDLTMTEITIDYV